MKNNLTCLHIWSMAVVWVILVPIFFVIMFFNNHVSKDTIDALAIMVAAIPVVIVFIIVKEFIKHIFKP